MPDHPENAPRSADGPTVDENLAPLRNSGRNTRKDPTQPEIGEVFDEHYQILSLIGEGGMGHVYRGKNVRNGQIVAIKILHEKFCQDVNVWLRFQQEAKTAGTLTHPNAVTIHDLGTADSGTPYLVMDYLEGCSLSDELSDQPTMPVQRAVPIMLQMCAALAHAHAKGIVHRDIKPSNVMLIELDGNKDYVKIVDFGIAKTISGDGEEGQTLNITRTGDFIGSPAYMSPEQCKGLSVDARSDVYSLGCVMYEMLIGKPPHVGFNPLDTINKHINEAPSSFKEAAPDLRLPRELEAIVFKALSRDPATRYQSIADLKHDLEKFQQSDQQESLTSKLKASIVLARLKKSPLKSSNRALPLAMLLSVIAVVAAAVLLPPAFDPMKLIDSRRQLQWERPPLHFPESELKLAKENTLALLKQVDLALGNPAMAVDGLILQEVLKAADRCANYGLYEEAQQLYQKGGNLLSITPGTRLLVIADKQGRQIHINEIRDAIGWARCDYNLGRSEIAERSYSNYLLPMLQHQDELKPLFVFQAMNTYGDLLFDKEEYSKAHDQFATTLRSHENAFQRYNGTQRYFLSLSKLADTERIGGINLIADGKQSEGEAMLKEAMRDYQGAELHWQRGSSTYNQALCQLHRAEIAELRKDSDAATLFGEAHKTMIAAKGKSSPFTAYVAAKYAGYLSSKGDFGQALPYRMEAWNILRDRSLLQREHFDLAKKS